MLTWLCVLYREKERREGEGKLQMELERLREQARQELERAKSYTKDLYERENRSSLHTCSMDQCVFVCRH